MLTKLGQLQAFISWDNFCHGFMAVTLAMHHANYYTNWQLRNLSKKWLEAVLKWVLNHARQQWDYWNNKLHKQQPNQIKDLAVNANIQEFTMQALMRCHKHWQNSLNPHGTYSTNEPQ